MVSLQIGSSTEGIEICPYGILSQLLNINSRMNCGPKEKRNDLIALVNINGFWLLFHWVLQTYMQK